MDNPFGRYRAEQMGESSWKYYVSPDDNLLSETPLIFEGSRGTGKTMFLLCNSWREKFAELNYNTDEILYLFSKNSFIGFYHIIDGRFVGNNLSGKGIENDKWISVFNTYFNIIIAKEILLFLQKCIELNIITSNIIEELNMRIVQKCSIICTEINLTNIIKGFDKILDCIEEYTNNPELEAPKLLSAGTLIKIIIEQIKRIDIFKETRFHILIDEFEELNKSQQMQINTLIKQSVFWLVYDICVKTNGIYTSETISGNEIIQEPHDFRLHKPELQDYDNSKKYIEFLKNVCRKRLSEFIDPNMTKYEDYLDIEYYLKTFPETQIQSEYKRSPNYKAEVTDILEATISKDPTTHNISRAEILDTLFHNNPNIERMHIALLQRKGISVEQLYTAAKEKTKEYESWKQNTLYATHFLLCNELGIEFKYHGLKVFAQLSSGVIRYFIEICKSAFDNAISNGFSFQNIRPITIKEQTDAALYVSETKVAKIDGFVPGGKILKRLVLNLGKIYFLIQSNKQTTLGEPEVNHFTTKLFEFKNFYSDANEYLEYALMHNILQTSLPTKTKSNDCVETADFHLNHIYCPYFKISHRRKRKLSIEPAVLRALILGSSDEINKIVKKYSAEIENQSSQGKLFE